MPYTEQFIALTMRNVKVSNAILRALEAMQAVNQASVEVTEGTRYKLNFSREIEGLKEALYLVGQDMNQ